MKRKRHTEEQIITILKEHEAGVKTADLCRKHGISEASFYNWKSKYGGLEVSDAKRLKGLESENAKLKKLLADAMLDNMALKDLLAKCMVRPGVARSFFLLSEAACVNVSGLSRVNRCCGQAMMRCARIVPKKCMVRPGVARSFFLLSEAACVNVSGLSRVNRCCGQAMMRCARIVP